MAVWLAAWEDDKGDRHAPTTVYVEVDPTRWSYADQFTTSRMKPQALQLGLSPRQHTTLMALGLLALVVTLMLVSHPSFVGTGGAEFNPLYAKLSDWMTGYPGRVVAAGFIIVGLVGGSPAGP